MSILIIFKITCEFYEILKIILHMLSILYCNLYFNFMYIKLEFGILSVIYFEHCKYYKIMNYLKPKKSKFAIAKI